MVRKTPRQTSLFGGYEPEPRDPRGRKAIAWSKQTAEKVVALAALQRTQEAIALDVGVSVKTLMRIYADELAQAADRIRQVVFETQLSRAVEKGSTSAANFVMAVLERQDLEEGVYRPRRARNAERVTAALPRQPAEGKKQKQQAAAEKIGGYLSPGAPPARLQ